MKSTLRLITATAAGVAAAIGLAVAPAEAAVSLSGASLVWIEDDNTDPSSYADTLGGNPRWNVYVRPAGGSFVNSGNGLSTSVDIPLDPGTYDFELWVHHESWGDSAVTNPGSYVNLFIGDRSGPAISARLSGGTSGLLGACHTK